MKLNSIIPTLLVILAVPVASLLAADKHAGHGAAASKAGPAADAQIIAQARASYPLKTCLVSDEALGSMGEAVGYVHRAAGQPDRVIFVCCKGCIDDFKAELDRNMELEQAKLKDTDTKLQDMKQRIENNEKMYEAQQRIKQRFEEDLAKVKK